MRRLIVASLLAFTLAGCANIGGKQVFLPTLSVANPVSVSTLADAKATYVAAQSLAVIYVDRYRAGNRCTTSRIESLTNLCSRRSIVLKIQKADRVAVAAIEQASDFIQNHPTLDASSLISAAYRAATSFYTLAKG